MARLRGKKLLAVYMMANGFSTLDIIGNLKLRWSTLSRWRAQPDFAARLETCKRELAEETEYMKTRMAENLAFRASRTVEGQLASNHCDLKQVETGLKVLKQVKNPSKRAQIRAELPKLAQIYVNLPEPGANLPLKPPIEPGL
jgi:hypothetical protein